MTFSVTNLFHWWVKLFENKKKIMNTTTGLKNCILLRNLSKLWKSFLGVSWYHWELMKLALIYNGIYTRKRMKFDASKNSTLNRSSLSLVIEIRINHSRHRSRSSSSFHVVVFHVVISFAFSFWQYENDEKEG